MYVSQNNVFNLKINKNKQTINKNIIYTIIYRIK